MNQSWVQPLSIRGIVTYSVNVLEMSCVYSHLPFQPTPCVPVWSRVPTHHSASLWQLSKQQSRLLCVETKQVRMLQNTHFCKKKQNKKQQQKKQVKLHLNLTVRLMLLKHNDLWSQEAIKQALIIILPPQGFSTLWKLLICQIILPLL